MILPTKSIASDRALLSVAGLVYAKISEPSTVSGLWDEIRRENAQRPLGYTWFLLALDLLYMLDLVWFDQDGLLRRSRSKQ